ncbi:PAS domain S-box protein [Lutibacter flavus]|uniref:histidine kinase n=1 Tax=Lutibacter flavus TaxID=691689 RepID=A0A238VNM5_9FLAO|nr:PAS domain S-box protein [Lutibacter flavus]SNR35079.1 PAS domain S-box-containing protein [Lutibacter flavus]
MSIFKKMPQRILTMFNFKNIKQRLTSNTNKSRENSYRKLLNNLNLIAVFLDTTGKITYCNSSFYKLTGYIPKEIIGKNWFDKMIPIENQKSKEIFFNAMKFKKIIDHYENPIITKFGEKRTVFWNNSLLKNDRDEVIGIASIGEDISIRQKAIENLNKSEKQFQSLVENINDLVMVTDAQGKFLYISPSVEITTGYTLKELQKHSPLTLTHPDDQDPTKKAISKILKNPGVPIKKTNRILHKNGNWIWIEGVVVNLLEDENIKAIVANYSDITEKRKTNQKLKEEQNKLLKIATTISGLICSLRLRPNGKIEMPYASAAIEDVYGFKFEEIKGENVSNIFSLIHEEDIEGVNESIDISAKNMTPWRKEFRYTHPQKGEVWIEGYSTPQLEKDGSIIWHGFITDITKRKKEEEQLIQTDNALKSIYNNLDVAIFSMDTLNNKMLQASVGHEAVFGYPPQDFMNNAQFWYELILPEDRPIVDSGYPIILAGKSLQHQVRIKRKDGGIRWIDAKMKPTLDSKGVMVLLDGIVTDITERKIAENQLRESQTLLKDALKISKLCAWEYDIELDKFTFNDQFYGLFKTTAEIEGGYTMSSKRYAERFLHPDDVQVVSEEIKKIIETEDPNYFSELYHRIICIDGDERIMNVNVRVEKDKEGKSIRSIGVSQDITEQKRSEKKLRVSEKKYRAIFENVKDVFFQTDLNWKIIDISPSIESLSGYSREEFIDGTLEILYYNPADRNKLIKETIEKGELKNYEVKLKTKEGLVKFISVNSNVILNKFGEPHHVDGVIRDITEKKKMVEELIVAKNKAEESDNLKTAFLHNISHEIRTPMNAIVGFSQLMKDPNLPQKKRSHFIDIINESSDQLLSIITDIVSIATIEAKQEKTVLKEINLNETLQVILENFLLKSKNKGNVELNFTPFSQEGIHIETDKTKFIQVLNNLIGNSLKYTVKGFVNFGYIIKESEIEFFVEDSGIGIASNMLDEIFNRFRQVENSDGPMLGGSGLGLSISKAYVELLGGKIWVNSELGKGSKFFFTIPHKNKVKPIISVFKDRPKLNFDFNDSITMLVAEDEDFNFMLIEELFSETNINLLRAENGMEVVELCKSNQEINIVLMDIKMPLLNGYEATKLIKEFSPSLPIIAQTAYSTEMDKNKALESGCDDFISKPFKKENIINKIIEQLNKVKSN